MTVKIVTDSTADIPESVTKELDITVIPQVLVFGTTTYRDDVDITIDEFYKKLLNEPIYPHTSQPTPQDFVGDFEKICATKNDGILAIVLSSKLSGTYNSAEQAAKKVTGCRIEVIDSQTVAMSLGVIVIAAARLAKAGKSLDEITAAARKMASNVKLFILFDTLEFLAKGGRIGKVKGLLGALLNVKPMVTIKDGELVPMGQVRSRSKGKEKLLEAIKGLKDIQDVAVLYSTTPDEAKELAGAIPGFPKEKVYVTQVGPVLATHAGPGVLGIAVRTKS
jgi:fatty acid kinase fatty acid binding subunit